MGKPTGFLEYKRLEAGYRPADERVKDYFEININLTPEQLAQQAARCMDCGIPFCHGAGCPLGNRIPEFNDLVFRGKWKQACDNLHSTNNFPEVTGRVCPAPCETACTLGINDDPVSIKQIELQIVERGWQLGWIRPQPAPRKTGKRVAVIGSGPAGLAAAQQLARIGHDVTVFERDRKLGGLLRYGIPDFKLDKSILDRRLAQMEAEGVSFETGVDIGVDLSGRYLRQRFDAILLTMGAGEPRDLPVPGRELEGIEYAMTYLTQQNRLNHGQGLAAGEKRIDAADKVVVVIGGGDTGSDCVGTANRQGAKKVYQFEILPQPPELRPDDTPWPTWPRVLRTSSSHKEGCTRRWCIATKRLTGEDNRVKHLYGVEVEWTNEAGQWKMAEKKGTEFTMDVDLVLLAMGFVHVVHKGLVEELGLSLDGRGNVIAHDFQTSQSGVFVAGDANVGASLVVRAIRYGRDAAEAIDRYLANP